MSFRELIQRPLSTAKWDARFGQTLSWLASLVVLVVGMLKLSRLPLSETELFFGVLLVLAVSLLGVLIGLVLPLAALPPRP